MYCLDGNSEKAGPLLHHNHTFIHCEDIVRLQRAGTMLAGLPA